MKKQGFVISQTRARANFFSTTSSYDSPKWFKLEEATVYQSNHQATTALAKLYQYGAYEAICIPLSEAFGNEDEISPIRHERLADVMDAAEQDEVCDKCQHEQCTCEDDEDDNTDISDDVEQASHENEEQAPPGKQFVVGQSVTYKGKSHLVTDDSGTGVVVLTPVDTRNARPIRVPSHQVSADDPAVREAFVMPVPAKDAAPSENKNTVTDLPKPEEVKFTTPGGEYTLADTAVISNDEKIKVPPAVLSDLRGVIDEKKATLDVSSDDAQSSFLMTTIDAFEQLHKLLSLRTPLGVKQAQIYMSTLMNAITMHLPSSTSKYITNGGRAPSLASRFADAWAGKKTVD